MSLFLRSHHHLKHVLDDAYKKRVAGQMIPATFWKQGDKRGVAFSVEGFASLAVAQGEISRAVQLWGASETFREAIGAPLPPSGRAHYKRDVKIVQNLLDEAAFNTAWATGRAMDLEEAITYTLGKASGYWN